VGDQSRNWWAGSGLHVTRVVTGPTFKGLAIRARAQLHTVEHRWLKVLGSGNCSPSRRFWHSRTCGRVQA